MGVIFRSKQSYLQVAYETLFNCGADITGLGKLYKPNEDAYVDERGLAHFGSVTQDKEHFIGTDEEWKKLQAQPDPQMVGGSYSFSSGEGCNELELSNPQVIEAMRAYIAARADDLITEVSS